MPESPSEAALNFAIDAWGERTSTDPDLIHSPGWTFGYYCEGILKDRGFMVVPEGIVLPLDDAKFILDHWYTHERQYMAESEKIQDRLIDAIVAFQLERMPDPPESEDPQ